MTHEILRGLDVVKARDPDAGECCGNCPMWVRPTQQCIIHSSSLKVRSDQWCKYYERGEPMMEWDPGEDYDPASTQESELQPGKCTF